MAVIVTDTFSASAVVSCLEQLSEATGSIETYGCCCVLLQLNVVDSGMELHVGCCSDVCASLVNVSEGCSTKKSKPTCYYY